MMRGTDTGQWRGSDDHRNWRSRHTPARHLQHRAAATASPRTSSGNPPAARANARARSRSSTDNAVSRRQRGPFHGLARSARFGSRVEIEIKHQLFDHGHLGSFVRKKAVTRADDVKSLRQTGDAEMPGRNPSSPGCAPRSQPTGKPRLEHLCRRRRKQGKSGPPGDSCRAARRADTRACGRGC